MDRAEGALMVAEKALFEAKKANSALRNTATIEVVEQINSYLKVQDKNIETLGFRIDQVNQLTGTLEKLEGQFVRLNEEYSKFQEADSARSDKIKTQLEEIAVRSLVIQEVLNRLSALEELPKPRDGKDGNDGNDGKDAEINIEELRSIYLEDVEARFENVYTEIQTKVNFVKDYVVERIQSLPDTESIVKMNLMNIPTMSEVRRIFDDEFDKVKSSLSSHGGDIQSIQIQQEEIPESVAEKVAKAISLTAESPAIHNQYQPQQQPVVVNITQPTSTKSSEPKRIVLRRDKDGNTTADVTTVDSSKKITRDKDGNPVANIEEDK